MYSQNVSVSVRICRGAWTPCLLVFDLAPPVAAFCASSCWSCFSACEELRCTVGLCALANPTDVQACDEAPMFIDEETFERLKSKWNDTEELKRVQRGGCCLFCLAWGTAVIFLALWYPCVPTFVRGLLIYEIFLRRSVCEVPGVGFRLPVPFGLV